MNFFLLRGSVVPAKFHWWRIKWRRWSPQEFVRQCRAVRRHSCSKGLVWAHDERIDRVGSIHDAIHSGCSTRVNVLGMDWRIHLVFPPLFSAQMDLAGLVRWIWPLRVHSWFCVFPQLFFVDALPTSTVSKKKTCKHGETRSKTNDFKSQFACILEASESTRMRMEESLPKCHEDHIAGKEDNSLQLRKRYTNLFLRPQANEDSRSKSSSGQRMGKTWKDFGVGHDKSQE